VFRHMSAGCFHEPHSFSFEKRYLLVVQWNPALRTPRYYGQFRFPQRKAHIFFLKLTCLLRTPVNTDNGHFSVSRATDSYTSSTPLYGHCLYLCIVYCHCHDYVLIRDFVPWSNYDRFRQVSTILLRNETVAK